MCGMSRSTITASGRCVGKLAEKRLAALERPYRVVLVLQNPSDEPQYARIVIDDRHVQAARLRIERDPLDRLQELQPGEGFDEVLAGAEEQAQPLLLKTGGDDHRDVARGGILLQTIEESPAVVARQHHVENDGLRVFRGRQAEPLDRVGGPDSLIADLRQEIAQQHGVFRVGFNAEDPGSFLALGQRLARGGCLLHNLAAIDTLPPIEHQRQVNVKVLPCPSTLSTVSVPPSRVASAFEIANPKPVPFVERAVSGFA